MKSVINYKKIFFISILLFHTILVENNPYSRKVFANLKRLQPKIKVMK